jgi:hypothetical protein
MYSGPMKPAIKEIAPMAAPHKAMREKSVPSRPPRPYTNAAAMTNPASNAEIVGRK